MRVIETFSLSRAATGAFPVRVSADAKILKLADDFGDPTLHVDNDTKANRVERIFRWARAGQPVPAGGEYVGSYQPQAVSTSVLHLYEIRQ